MKIARHLKLVSLFVLLALSGLANASYDFPSSGDRLTGVFTTQYDGGAGISFSAWVKKTDWDASDGGIVMLSVTTLDSTDSHALRQPSSGENIRAQSTDSGDGSSSATFTPSADEYDGTWVLVTLVVASDTDRKIYIENSTNTASNSGTRAISSVLDEIMLGNFAAGGSANWLGLLAEVCIWDTALSTANVDALQTSAETGPECSDIASGNVIGRWPLDTDGVLTNQGSDAGGNLSAVGATFDADHPTIGATAANSLRRRRAANDDVAFDLSKAVAEVVNQQVGY